MRLKNINVADQRKLIAANRGHHEEIPVRMLILFGYIWQSEIIIYLSMNSTCELYPQVCLARYYRRTGSSQEHYKGDNT